jgi:serine O-acetyltransferase
MHCAHNTSLDYTNAFSSTMPELGTLTDEPMRLSFPRPAILAFACDLRDSGPVVNQKVTELKDRLMQSYDCVGGINHLDGKNLPSKSAIASITVDLLFLLFPGFFEEKSFHASEVRAKTAALMESVARKLQTEIYKSLEYAPPSGLLKKDFSNAARNLTVELFEALPRIRAVLQTDAEAAYEGDPAAMSKEEVIVAYPFIEAIAVQRLAHELYLRKVALIPRIMTEWAHSRTGMDLHPGATIGTHFFIDHGTGTVVGETCSIGNHVKMYHGVTLGARSTSGGQELRGKKRHPTIEDDVTIYPGATILGGETVIGTGSTIGGNVFLMHSVPANCLVTNADVEVEISSKRPWTALDYQI